MPFLGTTGGGSVKQYGGQANLGYFIKNSLRLRSSASGYLNRTLSLSNRQTWTYSVWAKLGAYSSSNGNNIFCAGDGQSGTDFESRIDATTPAFKIVDQVSGTPNLLLLTTQVFRDPAAWYHVVIAIDTTQATASNRAKLYINGVQVTSFSTATYPTQNYNTNVNTAVIHWIGALNLSGSAARTYDGYLAEFNFIDGQALTPSSFGKTDAVTNQWIPKKFAGTYGTNGFYLKFADASAATAAAIGKDSSGNGNNFTPNNISVTAGATYDAMIDSPSLSAVASNYPTWNPLDGAGSQTTYSNGNLEATVSGNPAIAFTTMATPTTGKWYCEFTVGGTAQNGGDWMIGISDATKSLTERNWSGASGWFLYGEGTKYNNGTGVGGWSVSYTSGDVIGVAVDLDVGTLSFYKNGTNLGVAYDTGIAGKSMLFALGTGTGSLSQYQAARINCGQRPFAHTPPSGFKSLNTFNLP